MQDFETMTGNEELTAKLEAKNCITFEDKVNGLHDTYNSQLLNIIK